MTYETDTEFKQCQITAVTPDEAGFSLRLSDGFSLYVENGPITPKAGHDIKIYGPEFGWVRGIVIDGQVFHYSTAAEFKQRQAEAQAERLREARAAYVAGLAVQQAEIAKLPEPFQRRMAEFLKNAPDTAWQYQGYELATCQAAVAIAEVCKTPQAVSAFKEMSIDMQVAAVPRLDELGLMGEQFGMACLLAYSSCETPDNVWRQHATICPLVGCVDAGCFAVTVSQTSGGQA